MKTTKAAIVTYYNIDKKNPRKLAVVNLHSTLLRRPKTAKFEMFRILEQIENHEGPALVGGDFNTFTKKYFEEIKSALEVLGFEHAIIPSDPRKQIAQLDQVFTRNLYVESIEIDSTIVHSDHFPIFCKLRCV